MYCPNCEAEFDMYDIDVINASDKEVEVIFECQECSEYYTVTIAQEDLKS